MAAVRSPIVAPVLAQSCQRDGVACQTNKTRQNLPCLEDSNDCDKDQSCRICTTRRAGEWSRHTHGCRKNNCHAQVTPSLSSARDTASTIAAFCLSGLRQAFALRSTEMTESYAWMPFCMTLGGLMITRRTERKLLALIPCCWCRCRTRSGNQDVSARAPTVRPSKGAWSVPLPESVGCHDGSQNRYRSIRGFAWVAADESHRLLFQLFW